MAWEVFDETGTRHGSPKAICWEPAVRPDVETLHGTEKKPPMAWKPLMAMTPQVATPPSTTPLQYPHSISMPPAGEQTRERSH